MNALNKAGSILALSATVLALPASLALGQGSGKFERTQPAAPAPVKPSDAAPSPSSIAELQRKAGAKEKESGFCARTRWSQKNLLRWWEEGAVGSLLTTKGSDGTCGVYKMTRRGTNEEGDKCIVVESWYCNPAARGCGTQTNAIAWRRGLVGPGKVEGCR